MTTILFDSSAAAQEIAYMLRGEWDGLNAIIIEDFDRSALDLAIGLCDVKEWYFEGDAEIIKNQQEVWPIKSDWIGTDRRQTLLLIFPSAKPQTKISERGGCLHLLERLREKIVIQSNQNKSIRF